MTSKKIHKAQKARLAAKARQRLRNTIIAGTAAAVAIVVGIAVASGGGGGSGTAAPEVTPMADEGAPVIGQGGPQRGESAPDVQFARFGTGEVDQIANYRGKPLVVNFFASWCVPCLAELPRFQETYLEHADQVEFLGLNLQDSIGSATDVIESTGLTYPIGVDPDGRIFQAFGAFGMPTTVFVHADGTVAERFTGELTAEQLIAKLVEHGMLDPARA